MSWGLETRDGLTTRLRRRTTAYTTVYAR